MENKHGDVQMPGPDVKPNRVSVTAFGHDWDEDGDVDLLLGRPLRLVPNEGSPQQALFGDAVPLVFEEEPIVSSRVAPCIADWDSDGRDDLVMASGKDIAWCRNTGTKGRPALQPAQILISAEDLAATARVGPDEGQRQPITHPHAVCVADFNADGRMDLLLGNNCFISQSRTDEQQARLMQARGKSGELFWREYRNSIRELSEYASREERVEYVREALRKWHELSESPWGSVLASQDRTERRGGVWFFERLATRLDEAPGRNATTDSSGTAQSDAYEWACTTVDEKTGEPVAGVRISWDFRRPQFTAREDRCLWKKEFVSDREGRYDVSVAKSVVDAALDRVCIEYHHPQYLPSRNSFWPLRMPDDPVGKGLDHRHAKLKPGVEVTGLVVKPDGSPARNVTVMFARNRDGFGDTNGGYHHGFWTRTDEEGRYSFYTRNTWPQRVHWFPDEYEANSRALTEDFGEQETIRLKSGLALAGKVVDGRASRSRVLWYEPQPARASLTCLRLQTARGSSDSLGCHPATTVSCRSAATMII